jgi:arylsulfatase
MRHAMLLSLAALAAGCGGPPVERSPSKQNVLLIVVDTLRADHLSCYGYGRETSPNIDRLAAEGWRFEHAISAAPWTTPSIGALLTSRYPSMLGIADVTSAMPPDVPLLAEVLQAEGYATGTIVSHSFCSADWGFGRGFERFDADNVLGHFGISSRGVSKRALGFLEERASSDDDRPFFLWLHYFDPHNQYIPHDDHPFPNEVGDPGRIGPRTPFGRLRRLAESMTPGELAEVVRYYDSEIAFTDRQIGRVLRRLDELGLAEETLVVLTSDHGEELNERGHFGHAYSLFDELVRVPLILRIPGEAPRVVPQPVSLLDVSPTLLELVGARAPEGMLGSSLMRGLEGRTVFAETSRQASLRAAVKGPWKLVRDLETGEELLYYATDRTPVTEAPPELEELRAELDAWILALGSSARESAEVEISAELAEQLGELGYTEGDLEDDSEED